MATATATMTSNGEQQIDNSANSSMYTYICISSSLDRSRTITTDSAVSNTNAIRMFQERFKTNPLNLVIATALLMGTMVTVRAYSGLIPADPASPNKCIYRGGPLELGVNNGISPCQRLTCNKDGSILIEGCGKLAIENCNRGERINQGKPFPECCKLKYKCQQKDSPPYFIERDTAVRT